MDARLLSRRGGQLGEIVVQVTLAQDWCPAALWERREDEHDPDRQHGQRAEDAEGDGERPEVVRVEAAALLIACQRHPEQEGDEQREDDEDEDEPGNSSRYGRLRALSRLARWLRVCGGGVDGWRGICHGAEDAHASERGEEREGEQCAGAAAKQQGERAGSLHGGGFRWRE